MCELTSYPAKEGNKMTSDTETNRTGMVDTDLVGRGMGPNYVGCYPTRDTLVAVLEEAEMSRNRRSRDFDLLAVIAEQVCGGISESLHGGYTIGSLGWRVVMRLHQFIRADRLADWRGRGSPTKSIQLILKAIGQIDFGDPTAGYWDEKIGGWRDPLNQPKTTNLQPQV